MFFQIFWVVYHPSNSNGIKAGFRDNGVADENVLVELAYKLFSEA
jgi:hypothetical protein